MFDGFKRMLGWGEAEAGTAMISCDEVRSRLFEYLDGELEAVSAEEVKKHLDACPECYPRVAFEKQFLQSVRGAARDVATGSELKARIIQALRDEGLED